MAKLRPLALLSFILFASVCSADHLPPELQARGTPEKKLAGINLEHTRMSTIVKMYGKPTEVKDDDYYWIKSRLRLHLVVYRGKEIRGGEYIGMIRVEGSRVTGVSGRTGLGLKLGDSLADLKRIYGRRFKERNIPKRGIHDVMVQWATEEYALVADLDPRGKIWALSLISPE